MPDLHVRHFFLLNFHFKKIWTMRLCIAGLESWFGYEALVDAADQLGADLTDIDDADVTLHLEGYHPNRIGKCNILAYHGVTEFPSFYVETIDAIMTHSMDIIDRYTAMGVRCWYSMPPMPLKYMDPKFQIERNTDLKEVPVAFVLDAQTRDYQLATVATKYGLRIYTPDVTYVDPQFEKYVVPHPNLSVDQIVQIGVSAACVVPITTSSQQAQEVVDPLLLLLYISGACVLGAASARWVDFDGCALIAGDIAQYDEFIYRAIHEDIQFRMYRKGMRSMFLSRLDFSPINYIRNVFSLASEIRICDILGTEKY